MRLLLESRSVGSPSLLGQQRIRALARAVVAHAGVPVAYMELSVVFVDTRRSREVNERYRHKPGPTDILSFAYSPPVQATAKRGRRPVFVNGEILLCPPIIRRRAGVSGRTVRAEAERLLVHGILHLLGYDHKGKHDSQLMERREEHILGKPALGVGDEH